MQMTGCKVVRRWREPRLNPAWSDGLDSFEDLRGGAAAAHDCRWSLREIRNNEGVPFPTVGQRPQ